jgi:peptidoglycan hydrolase-like protein with peptidoglycan-binding domain
MLESRRLGRDPQLVSAALNKPPLREGSTGTGVAILQELLADLGFAFARTFAKSGRADGIFGAETKAALVAFQTAHALKADGVAGNLTLHALDREVLADFRLEVRDGGRDARLGYW